MKLPKHVRVGHLEYRLRPYHKKRRDQKEDPGHGWIRESPRAEVNMEAKILLDEVVRLRHMVATLLYPPTIRDDEESVTGNP